MTKTILTTSETAELLGISVRTAQMMIEGGALPSWKTPGGHRRVHRDDVLRILAQSDGRESPSSRVVLIAPTATSKKLESAIAAVPGCSTETYPNIYSALLEIGLHVPAAVVFDMTHQDEDYSALLRILSSNSELSGVKVIIVDEKNGSAHNRRFSSRITATKPERLAETVRAVLSDKPDSAITLPKDLPFPVAPNEGQRLAAVQRSGLMDTGVDEVFDRLTWLASETLQAPVALFTTLTPDRQVFKSKQGLEMDDTPRDWAFCNYTILQRGVFTVGNLARDERFKDNPAVRKDPKFRFYAGVPVVDADAFALGSLCIIDKKPRTLSDGEAEILRSLAYVMSEAVQARTPKSRLHKM